MNNISGPAFRSSSFKYQKVYDKGKPIHDREDSFTFRHPPMPPSKRAKIFSPFDALKGFDDELLKAEREVNDVYSNEYSEFDDDCL